MRTVFILFFCAIAFSSCRKKSTPKPPEAVRLIFPEDNSECTTGTSLGANTSQVEFSWSAANHTESYELRVTNINTGTVQTINTLNTSARLPLTKGEPFSWFVQSKNTQVQESVSSERWHFYNAGSITTFAPFPATLISPGSAESIFKDVNNEITLSWSASDLDNDILEYEVYFSTEATASVLLQTVSNTTTLKASVVSNMVYYWQIVVVDREGNRSNSGINSFRVL